MPVRSFAAALLIGAAAAPAPAQTALTAPSAQSLVARNLEAKGGAAAIAAIKGISFEGRTIFPGDFEVKYHEDRAATGAHIVGRTVFTIQGLDIVNAFDGRSAWKVNPLQGRKDAETMSSDEARALADSYLLDGPLLDAARAGSRVSYLGQEDFDGTLAYKVKVVQKDGDEFVYWLDPDTFLEIKVDETRRIRGSRQVTETELGDYEKVAGVYFPMSIESWSQGHPNDRSRTVIATATANPTLNPGLFEQPGQRPSASKPEAPDASEQPPAEAEKTDPAQPSSPPKGN